MFVSKRVVLPPNGEHGLHMIRQALDSPICGPSKGIIQPGGECEIMWLVINVVVLLCSDLIGI